jgi:integrase
MALELRPKKSKPGKPQKWVVRFQIPTGKRNKTGKLLYKNWARVIGERGKMTKKQAEAEHDNYKVKIKGGYVLDSPTLEEFSLDFIIHKRDVEKLRSTDRYILSLKYLINFFGATRTLNEITPKNIDEYKSFRLKTVKPPTVNRELECLKALINLAEKWNQFTGQNPVSKAGLLKEIREEQVPVSIEEERILIPALMDNLSWICEFALNTGMRIGEILQLRDNAISYNKLEKMNFAKIEATEQKGKKFREVPLNNRAVELIEKSRKFKKKIRSKAPEIFVNSNGERYKDHDSVYPTVLRTCKKLGLRNINPHLFRHTFITRLIENGADPITVQEIVGHTNIKTLLRYTHLRSSKYKAVNLLNISETPGKSGVKYNVLS